MPEWFEGLDQELLDHATKKGWNKPLDPEVATGILKSHFNAEKMTGVPADQLIRVPKGPDDPNYQSVYERIAGLGTPKDPSGYDFSPVRFKDGSPLEADDVDFVRGLAAELKLPVHAARVIAAKLADRTEAVTAAGAAITETGKQMNDAAIRAAWGQDYDQKAFSATRAAEAVGFTPEVLAAMAKLPPTEYVVNMNALVKLGTQMNEAAMLRGGRAPTDTTAGMTPEQARARIDELRTDQRWLQQFAAGDSAAQALFRQLTERMVVRQ